MVGKKRLPHSGMHFEHHLWLLDSILPKLLDLPRTPPSDGLEHRRGGPMFVRPGHGARGPNEARSSGNVHLLLLLHRDCNSFGNSLHFPIVACPLHRFLNSIPPLHHHYPTFRLRVTKVVLSPRTSERGRAAHAYHCPVQWQTPS